jgi:dTDP-4-amino-4,6-dideoxygalactose transaminase
MSNLNKWPVYSIREINAVNKVLKGGKVNYWTGKKCTEFESKFRKKFDLKYTVAVANGSLALDCALKTLNLNKNDEIIVTPKSYIASASCVINAGAKPVFADVDLNTQNLLVSDVRNKITEKTKAIICVHLAGYPCDLDEILKLCKKNKIILIEDCSQAHGSKYKNKYVGSFGDISTWSFCNDKIISTGGEGGMIACKNKKVWKKIWAIKDCGKSYDRLYKTKHKPGFKWIHDNFGTNMRLTEMQAAIGIVQLKYLNNWIKQRRKNFFFLLKNFKEFKIFRVQTLDKNIYIAPYRFCFFVIKKNLRSGWSREKILVELNKKKIPCTMGSCSEIYKERAFIKKMGRQKLLKNANLLGRSGLAIPVHPNMNNDDLNYIIKQIKIIYKKSYFS